MRARERLWSTCVIVGRSGSEAFSPFLDPSEGVMGRTSIILKGPGGLKVEQRAEQGSVGQPAVFHGVTSVS